MTVINITDGKPNSEDNDPEENVVKELERLLQLAKEGKLRFFALAGLGAGQSILTVTGDGDIMVLLGLLKRLDHFINTDLDVTENIIDGG